MIHLDRASDTPLMNQIVLQLAGQIQSGQLPAGSRLPSIRKLAALLEVSSATVVAAYDRLTARGLIASRAASGYFVLARNTEPVRPRLVAAHRERLDSIWLIRRMLEQKPGQLVAGSGFLPESWLEDTLSSRLLTRVARQEQRTWAAPGCAEGYLPLRQQLALKMKQAGIPAEAEQILLTFGATHALDLVLRALLSPGDTVAAEEPGYFALWTQLRSHGLRVVPIPRHMDGPDLEALESACQHFRPKIFFTQTLMHNPTGGSTSVANAARLVQLAERHDLLLVEDDVYGDLHPAENPVRLSQLDQLRRTVFIGSFSKVLSSSIRVGYLAAPPALFDAFLEAKLLSVLNTSEFDERLVHEVLVGGGYRKHLERVRMRLAKQWPSVLKGLRDVGLGVVEAEHVPLFAWAALPEAIDEEILVRDAEAHGFILAPGSFFHCCSGSKPHIRFSVAYSNSAPLFSYLGERLRALQDDGWPVAATVSTD